MDHDTALSRRTLLRNGFLLVMGAFGFKVAETLSATPALAETKAGKTFSLTGTDWRYWPASLEPGAAPEHGQRATLTGRLTTAGGTAAGEFTGTSFFVDGAFVGTAADTTLQFHTFGLADGTIAGMGVAGPGTSAFTIIGGTGAYAGASGTYSGQQSPMDLGGDGSASFTFSIA